MAARKKTTTIDGYPVSCSPSGVLTVDVPTGAKISVLPRGTHAALDPLGKRTKSEIEDWWKAVRSR